MWCPAGSWRGSRRRGGVGNRTSCGLALGEQAGGAGSGKSRAQQAESWCVLAGGAHTEPRGSGKSCHQDARSGKSFGLVQNGRFAEQASLAIDAERKTRDPRSTILAIG
jgi:hypothetical protein